MWGKGPYHYDGVVRVPLLMRWPRHSEAGYKHEGVVSYVDVAPTILEIAGLPIPVGPTPPVPEAPNAPGRDAAWRRFSPAPTDPPIQLR